LRCSGTHPALSGTRSAELTASALFLEGILGGLERVPYIKTGVVKRRPYEAPLRRGAACRHPAVAFTI